MSTLRRNGLISLIGGTILAVAWPRLANWPMAVALMLWPSFGGHWVEVFFLSWLRPRLPQARMMQTVVRLSLWFAAGIGIARAMEWTALMLGRSGPWPSWWLAGMVFTAVELLVHLMLRLRGRPCLFDGRG